MSESPCDFCRKTIEATLTPSMPGRILCSALMLLLASSGLSAFDWRAKVDPWVAESAAEKTSTEFLVFLTEQADLSAAEQLPDKRARGQYVVERLRTVAASTQSALLNHLAEQRVPHRAFWIANMIWVRSDLETIRSLARRVDVAHLYANPLTSPTLPHHSLTRASTPQGIEWNLVQIGAPDFWSNGLLGSGVVVAGQDTGYDWEHPALKNQYRGWDGLNASHDFNWHDAIHTVGPGSSCGADSPVPCDDHSHGTHTMGILVGDDGAGNQIGVAPQARWIGCRNMDENGVGTPASYAECFQFFVAPTRVDGTGANPALAPHVINNSWTCPPDEGCTDPYILQTVVQNTRAAGIVVVASAGNDGPDCSSINSPPAIYDAALTVGATDNTDAIWNLSSRGGIPVDERYRTKPNVTAPGVGVRSSVPNGGYSSWSGTSMAGPHVAGQIALLISAVPGLAGRTNTLEACVESTAIPLADTLDCSGVAGRQIPNNSYGRGRVDLQLPLPVECSESFIFKDDFETGESSDWN